MRTKTQTAKSGYMSNDYKIQPTRFQQGLKDLYKKNKKQPVKIFTEEETRKFKEERTANVVTKRKAA